MPVHELKGRNRRPGAVEARGAVRRRCEPLRDRQLHLGGPRPSAGEGTASLEEVVLTTLAALAAGHPVECPVCGGPLRARHGCSRCGSELG